MERRGVGPRGGGAWSGLAFAWWAVAGSLPWACALAVGGCALGATTRLDPPVHRRVEAPSIEPGFYRVRREARGRVAEGAGVAPIGSVVHVHEREEYDASTHRLTRGVRILGDGFETRASVVDGGPVHVWRSRPGVPWEGTATVASAGARQLRVVLHHDATGSFRTYRLTFHGERLGRARTSYVSHRGAAMRPQDLVSHYGNWPANTMPAFEDAILAGYDGFELDVRLSRDGRFAVAHDESLYPTTTCPGDVRDHTLAELRRCWVTASTVLPGLGAFSAPLGARMPALSDVLGRYLEDERVEHIVIDVKPGLSGPLIDATDRALAPHQSSASLDKIVFLVRSDGLAQAIRTRWPRAHCALEGPVGTEPFEERGHYMPIRTADDGHRHDIVSVNLGLLVGLTDGELGALVDDAHTRGYPVMAWTINDGPTLLRFRRSLPSLDWLLSDAPYDDLVRLELAEALGTVRPDRVPSRARSDFVPGSDVELGR